MEKRTIREAADFSDEEIIKVETSGLMNNGAPFGVRIMLALMDSDIGIVQMLNPRDFERQYNERVRCLKEAGHISVGNDDCDGLNDWDD
ncbi:hypothetical protein KBD59_05300 [Candidatus Gracilibacteria bacterium]|nr:hypothetical protein [Candidatus Gracilibacteria bacterium]